MPHGQPPLTTTLIKPADGHRRGVLSVWPGAGVDQRDVPDQIVDRALCTPVTWHQKIAVLLADSLESYGECAPLYSATRRLRWQACRSACTQALLAWRAPRTLSLADTDQMCSRASDLRGAGAEVGRCLRSTLLRAWNSLHPVEQISVTPNGKLCTTALQKAYYRCTHLVL